MGAPRLIVVGSVAYDDIETPARAEKGVLGGSAIYSSLVARMLVDTGIVAIVGRDFRPEDVELLRSRGVNLAGLETAQELTLRWGGRYDQDLHERETLFTHLNAFANFVPHLPSDFKEAAYILLANIDPDVQLQVLEQCTGPRFVACDTMNFWIQNKRTSLLNLLPKVDALFLNDMEAFRLTGQRNVLAAARWIQKQGVMTVVIKKGEHGAVVISQGNVHAAPAFLLETVQDPTGAGDAFAGGMMGTIACLNDTSFETFRFAAAVGTVAASFCVERFGPARLAEVTRSDLRSRLQLYKTLTSIPHKEI